MKVKHVVVLGGGISGLTAAWFLKKKSDSQIKITVLEEGSKCGGWMQTVQEQGFLFEKGPRSFRTQSLGEATARLISELGLKEQIISADSGASSRFIYREEKLQVLPDQLWKIPFSPLTKGWLKVFWNEWRQKKYSGKEETIYEFFGRRLSPEWAERLVDPVISGIFAGDIRRLSLRSCFSSLYALEQEHGSLLKGFLFNKNYKPPKDARLDGVTSSLFSFRGGMKTLIEALVHNLQNHLVLNTSVDQLVLNSDCIQIKMATGVEIEADHLISAIPSYRLATLLKDNHPFLAADLDKLNYASVMVVNLGYWQSVLKQKGFGYLIPSKEDERVLGCIWDSSVFPQQNSIPEATRLTLMLGGAHHPDVTEWSQEKGIAIALVAIERQLGLYNIPDCISVSMAKQAIPQYEVGYIEWLTRVQDQISFITKGLTCIGPAFNGVSINDCIQRAFEVTQNL